MLSRPILDDKSRNPREFSQVVGDKRQSARFCNSGDQHVIGSDWRASAGQVSADVAGGQGILAVEVKQWEIGE